MAYTNPQIYEEFIAIRDDSNLSRAGKIKEGNNVGTGYFKKDRYLIKLQILIKDGKVKDARYLAKSCTVVLATINRMCRDIINKSLSELLEVTNQYYIDLFKLNDVTEKQNVMVKECILAAVNNYMGKDDT